MAYTSEELFIAEMTAIVAARGVARMHVLMLHKGVISELELEAARTLMLRDFDQSTPNKVPGHPALPKFEERRALLEAAWTAKSTTTEEPTRKGL